MPEGNCSHTNEQMRGSCAGSWLMTGTVSCSTEIFMERSQTPPENVTHISTQVYSKCCSQKTDNNTNLTAFVMAPLVHENISV